MAVEERVLRNKNPYPHRKGMRAQMDMAMALSQADSRSEPASAHAGADAREEDDVARAMRLSLQPGQASSAAEALSFKLWDAEWCAPACRCSATPLLHASRLLLLCCVPCHPHLLSADARLRLRPTCMWGTVGTQAMHSMFVAHLCLIGRCATLQPELR